MGFDAILAGTFGPPRIFLTPNRGLREVQAVRLSADRFPANPQGFAYQTDVYWDWSPQAQNGTLISSPSNSPPPDAQGKFVFDFNVPAYSAPGAHLVHVCVNSNAGAAAAVVTPEAVGPPPCQYSAQATFRIPRPTLLVNRNHGRAGEQRQVIGNGFRPASTQPYLEIDWDPAGPRLPLYGPSPAGASFNVQITIPMAATFGAHVILACDTGKGCGTPQQNPDQASVPFSVPYPKIFLSRSQAVAGDAVQVSGTGMYASRTLRLFFGPNGDPFARQLPSHTTNANGDFGPFTIQVPNLPPGPNYRVTACSVDPRLRACDPAVTTPATFDSPFRAFTINATPTPTPRITPGPTPPPTTRPTQRPTQRPTLAPVTQPPTPAPTPQPSASLSPSPEAPSPSPEPPSPSPEPVTPAPVITPEPTPSAEVTAAPLATVAPSTGAAPQASAAPPLVWPQFLHTPSSGRTLGNLGALGGSALLALLVAFLVPFPGTLFNKTVEANHAEIMGWFAKLKSISRNIGRRITVGPLRPFSAFFGKTMTGGLGVWIFLALTALVYSFLSPSFGFDLNSLALFLGLLIGLAFITAAFDLPLRVYHRRRSRARDVGALRALWWTLLVAIICVLVSRLAGFQPGYLYGLIISIVFVTEVTIRDEGFGTWLASLWLIVLSVLAWLLLGVVRTAGGDPWFQLFLQTVLVTFVVAGVEALVIGLLPMRFLPGHPLFKWKRTLWFPVFALAVFGYLLILVDPANGYLSDDSRTPMIVGIIFLVAFGTISVSTWAYFRYRPARKGGDRPGEAPEPPAAPA